MSSELRVASHELRSRPPFNSELISFPPTPPILCHAESPGNEPAGLPFVHDTWETLTTAEGSPNDSIRALRVCGERLWVGTDGGLALFDGGVWTTWRHLDARKKNALPSISAIDIDGLTGDLWLGTWGGGLVRLSGGRFDRYDQFNSGLAGDLVFDVAVADGRIWAATNGGVSAFHPVRGTWELYLDRRADGPETAVVSLEPDADGAVLHAATWCDGLQLIAVERTADDGPAKPVTTHSDDPPPAGPCGNSAVGSRSSGGVLWWVTRTDLFRRSVSGTWEQRTLGGRRGGGGDQQVYCLTPRGSEEAWVGTDRGLMVLADWSSDTWATYRRCDNSGKGLVTVRRGEQVLETHLTESIIPDNRIRCIAFQGDDVWVGTANGLARGAGRGRWGGLSAERRTSQRDTDRAKSHALAACPSAAPAAGLEARPSEPVAIAVWSPANPTIFLPGQNEDSRSAVGPGTVDVPAVQLAVEQANARGGYRGLTPFAVVLEDPGYSRYGWTLPEDDLVALAGRGEVVGIIGSLGLGSRFAAAALLRTEVPLVNAGPAAAGADVAATPWVFGCRGHDADRCRKLLDYIFDRLGHTRLAVVRTPGRPAKTRLDLAARHAQERGHPLVAEVTYDPQAGGLGPVLEALRRSRAQAVFTWCDIGVSANILRSMRAAGMSQLFVGSEHIVTADFVEQVGCDPGRVIALWSCARCDDQDAVACFAAAYRAKFRRSPKPDAHRGYNATRHLLQVINLAGPDREVVRQTLRAMNTAYLARLEDGRWTFGDTDESR